MVIRVTGFWESVQFPTPNSSTDFDAGHGINEKNYSVGFVREVQGFDLHSWFTGMIEKWP